MNLPVRARFATLLTFALGGALARAQGPGPLPPPPPPPPANPLTPAKVQLGRLLFWDEQLSSTRTVACATCHVPERGGSDPRSNPLLGGNVSPGADLLFGTPDDIRGSPGVVRNLEPGDYASSAVFGLSPQVTGRKAPSAINAAYSQLLFWDGRAGPQFLDPVSGAVVLQGGAALESQSVGPIVNDLEMAHVGRDWNDVTQRVVASRPLALATSVPPNLVNFINGRSYPEIFGEAFGTTQVTASRIAMAIASYERTQFSNQAPIDAFFGGNPNALTPLEQQGLQVFNSPQAGCIGCHAGSLFSNNTFRYIGVRPAAEDPGRFAVTGNPGDLGRMRVPSLRNVELRAPYFHTGSMATLEDVVEFYDRGGDFNAPNKDPLIHALNLTSQQKQALVAFLKHPLTDPRVVGGQPPFDHPTLFAGSPRAPQIYGAPTAGSGGFAPRMIALAPPMIGNPQFTVGLEHGRGGAPAGLLLDLASSGGIPFGQATSYLGMTPFLKIRRSGLLTGVGPGNGWTSIVLDIPFDPALVGTSLYGQWFVRDSGSGGRFSASAAFAATHF
jgi:cytochrome c peroxidase